MKLTQARKHSFLQRKHYYAVMPVKPITCRDASVVWQNESHGQSGLGLMISMWIGDNLLHCSNQSIFLTVIGSLISAML